MTKWCTYKIVNGINNKFYIGSTMDPKRRHKEHISLLKNNKHHCIYLQRAWNRYNKNDFDFIIIKDNIFTEKLALIEEQKLLDKFYKYPKCYNTNPNACKPPSRKGISIKHTDESKKKISIKARKSHDHQKKIIKLKNKSGKIIEWFGIGDFCRQHRLLRNKINYVLSGQRKSHKGWSLPCDEEK